jgi:hypothetical protein
VELLDAAAKTGVAFRGRETPTVSMARTVNVDVWQLVPTAGLRELTAATRRSVDVRAVPHSTAREESRRGCSSGGMKEKRVVQAQTRRQHGRAGQPRADLSHESYQEGHAFATCRATALTQSSRRVGVGS